MEASCSLRAADMDPNGQLHGQQGYQSKAGSIMHVMVGTRPDLAFSVSMLSRFNSAPTTAHHGAAKRVLRYLHITRTFGINYDGNRPLELLGYSDADWAGDKDTRKSTGSYVFTMLGGAVTWESKRQATVALSSTEAEYMGYTGAAKGAMWLRNILIGIDTRKPLSGNSSHNSQWGQDSTTFRVQ